MWLTGPASLRNLYHDAETLLGMNERFLPLWVIKVGVDDIVVVPLNFSDRFVNVRYLEGQVMRARPGPVKEAPQKIAASVVDWLQELQFGAVSELGLGEIERRSVAFAGSAKPSSTEVVAVANDVVPSPPTCQSQVV